MQNKQKNPPPKPTPVVKIIFSPSKIKSLHHVDPILPTTCCWAVTTAVPSSSVRSLELAHREAGT